MENSYPWKHFVFNDFLPANDLVRIQQSLKNHRDGFLIEDDDELEINYKFLPDLSLAKYFLSADFRDFLEKTTGLSLTLNPTSLVQLRMMTPQSPYFPSHVDSQDVKSLVCLLYLSPDWTPANGGELVLHAQKDSDPLGPYSKVIEPLANRLVLFCSEDHHWHSVNKVQDWIRYSIIMEWFISGQNEL